MSEALITYLTGLFQADLDARNDAAMQQMAAEWLKVEARLRADIELLAAELAAPPAQPLKLDPITEMVVKMKDAGYAPDYIQQLLAGQGIFKIPDIPQPQARELKAWQLAKLQRYVRLLAQVQAEIERFTGKVATPIIDQLLADSALAGLQNSLALIDAAISSGGGDVIDFSFDRLGIEAVQNIVAIAGAGQPLGDLLAAAYPLAANGITNELVYGTAIGRNPRETARVIIKSGLAQGLNHILLVSRDQQVRAVREAGRQQYLKIGITAYRRLAAKQAGRTCLACLALDQSVWPSEELMPLHPQDRCLAPGQIVITKRGLIPVEEIQPGDKVLTHLGRFKRVIQTKTRHHTGRLIKLIYNGRELFCTPDHKILTQRGWVEAQNLKSSDKLF